MTDKQIIIDGVNVKDCKRRIGKDNFCRYYKRPCAENNYNCIWKKYLRKEQECEELRKQYNCYACDTCKGKEDYINIKRHCENAIKSLHNKLAELDQLKQTLAEIKEIAEKIDDSDGCAYGDYDCDNCSSLEQETVCTYKVKKLILQKISDCEENNDMENN